MTDIVCDVYICPFCGYNFVIEYPNILECCGCSMRWKKEEEE